VVGFVYQRFRATLSRQLRLSSSASDAELADAVQGRLGWKKRFEIDHGACLGGQPAQKVAPDEALGLIRNSSATRAARPEEENCKGEVLIVENITRLAAHVRAEMSKVIVGQQESSTSFSWC